MTMSQYGADPYQGLQQMASLLLADSADALHRVLVLHRPGWSRADATEPFRLLRKFHATEPQASMQTAVLLLTDRRWKNACGQLVRVIADSGMFDDEQLDLLATTFLAAGDAVYWAVPDDWFSQGVDIVLDEGLEVDLDGDDLEVEDEVPVEGPTVARRDVHPPLRRWAAARAVRRDPHAWGRVMARSDELGGRRGAFVALGLLDALDVLPAATQKLLVEQAVRAPDQAVRLAGCERLAQRVGATIASEQAKADPSAKVRAWAMNAASRSVRSEPEAGADAGGEQTSLF
jgi:hypothetical protein